MRSYIVGGQKNRTNDVAIIRIPKLTLGDNIKRIAIYSKQIKEKTSIKAYGWGQTEDGKQSIILRGATLITGTLSDCKKLQSDFVDNGPLICLPGKYTSGVSTCSGDSGTGATLDDGKTPMLAAFDSHVRWEGVQTCSATTSVHYFVHVYYHLNFIMSATSLSKDDLCKA
ncbi:hypothetical protein GGI11_002530 [Coemansia sp. RSA 2049]|nr:hypothetical protein GGI11_002530 [Coemansia sp. RSA 2049]